MKSGTQVTTDVRSLIAIPEVLNNISGKVYPYTLRRTDLVSIVVSCYTISNQFIQNATVNVNIHCPMLSVAQEGSVPPKNMQIPDTTTFDKVSVLILPFLDCQWKFDFNTEVESPGVLIRDTDGSYFFNIRVKYRSLQSDYKNI